MFNTILKNVNEILIDEKLWPKELGLLNGKMGLAFYFFKLSRYSKNPYYYQLGEKILREISQKIPLQTSVDIENGLSGIALGMDILITNEYIPKVDLDDMFVDVDAKVYEIVSFELLENPDVDIRELFEISFYLLRRVNYTKSIDLNRIFKRTLIEIINRIHHLIIDDTNSKKNEVFSETKMFNIFWGLPNYIILISELENKDFYSHKIHRIINEIAPYVLSLFPVLTVNRLYLMIAIKKLLHNTSLSLKDWEAHALLLEQNIIVKNIFDNDFTDKMINLKNGISGLLFFINYFREFLSPELFNELRDIGFNKIFNSTYWVDKEFFNKSKPICMQNGLIGISLLLIQYQNGEI